MNKNILVIEDDESIAEVLGIILQGHGYNVIIDSTGDSILQSVFNTTIDLVIVDYSLSHRSGDEIITFIKNQKTLKKVPCILMSAIAPRELLIIAKRVKADDYLVKPFDMDEFVEKVQKLL